MKKSKKYILGAITLLIAASGFTALSVFSVFAGAVPKDSVILVPHGATLQTVTDSLGEDGEKVLSIHKFVKAAKLHKLDGNIRSGRYLLKPGQNYRDVVTMLRSGNQSPVNLTFNNIRSLPQLAGRISKQIEPDSTTMAALLVSDTTAAYYGYTNENFMSMFIPDTYQVYWNMLPEGFTNRMQKEHERFWNDERIAKADLLGLTPAEVYTLASIVYEETNKTDEMADVAGVYINRLRKGMLLQADPTVKFAIGDFTLKRILFRHLEVDSPYNTYKYAGLPPGPICMPSVRAIDAVLNYNKHDYIYFCAKADFSGYHSFARTLEEHNRNAKAYAAALNRAGIR